MPINVRRSKHSKQGQGGDRNLLLGCWYLFYLNYDGRRLTHREMARDLKRMADSGMRVVYLTVLWADVCNGPEKYELDLLDDLLDLSEQYGLKVIIGIIVDTAPPWLFAMYPDARYVAETGEVINATGGRELIGFPGLCSDSPAVVTEMQRFYQLLARRYGKHPALYGWDVWPEFWLDTNIMPGHYDKSFCYCSYTTGRFREWLNQRYASPKALKRAWGIGFASFDQVTPPLGGKRPVTAWLDWKQFLVERQAQRLARFVKWVREIDPHHVIIGHAALSSTASRGKTPIGDMAVSTLVDDWRMAKPLDLLGVSLYAAVPESTMSIGAGKEVYNYSENMTPERRYSLLDLDIARNLDGIRGAALASAKDFLVAELPARLDAGKGLFRPDNDPLHNEALALWSWMAVARQARGILAYEWRGITESVFAPAWGLCDIEGELTERARCFIRTMTDIRKIEPWMSDAPLARADIALLFDPTAYLLDWVHGVTYSRKSLLGYYRAFWTRNYPVDIVHVNELATARSYKVLYVSYPVVMTEQTRTALRRFVERGGRLVIEALCGAKDEKGNVRRRAERRRFLDGLGVDTGELCSPADMTFGAEIAALDCALVGTTVPTILCRELLRPAGGSRVLGAYPDGAPGLVLAGNVLNLSSFLGLAYSRTAASALADLLIATAAWAGVHPHVEVGNVPSECFVEARLVRNRADALCFLMNHSFADVKPGVRVRLPRRGYNVYDALTGGKPLSCGRLEELEVAIPRRGTRVLRLVRA